MLSRGIRFPSMPRYVTRPRFSFQIRSLTLLLSTAIKRFRQPTRAPPAMPAIVAFFASFLAAAQSLFMHSGRSASAAAGARCATGRARARPPPPEDIFPAPVALPSVPSRDRFLQSHPPPQWQEITSSFSAPRHKPVPCSCSRLQRPACSWQMF